MSRVRRGNATVRLKSLREGRLGSNGVSAAAACARTTKHTNKGGDVLLEPSSASVVAREQDGASFLSGFVTIGTERARFARQVFFSGSSEEKEKT